MEDEPTTTTPKAKATSNSSTAEALRIEVREIQEQVTGQVARADQLDARTKRLDREILMMYGCIIFLTVALVRSEKLLKTLKDAANAATEPPATG